jgi:ribosomal-protein-alanine N-acetyltransferase
VASVKELITDRLLLIPCSLDMAKSLILHREELAIRSPIQIPEDWPSLQLKGYLPIYIEKLEKNQNEYGWGVWIIIKLEEKKIIGNIGFKGRPDNNGVVEIAYTILKEERQKGYGCEAAKSLIEWAYDFSEVKRIIAECEDSNRASIRILEKIGMKLYDTDKNFLKWELRLE